MKNRDAAAVSFNPKAYIHLKCPLCDNVLERRRKATTSTYVMAALGAILIPVIAGLFLIHAALKNRPVVYICSSCGRTT